MGIPTAPGACCSLSLGDIWQCLAWQLNASGMCWWKACTELGQTAAFPSLPEMLMWAGIRAGGRHSPAYQHVLPPVSPFSHLPVARWTEQAGGQHRMHRIMSPSAEGPSFLMPYPVWKATRRGNATVPERHTSGKVSGMKRASSTLTTFNWVIPGFRALLIQRWCRSKWSLGLLLFKVITTALVVFSFQWCSK